MKKICLIPGIIAIFFLSCEKSSYDELEISMGSVCGWCAGSDSLHITSEKTHYNYTKLCTADFSIDEQTSRKDWDELVDILDIREFEKINLNSCFSCVDGCDTWICINHNSGSHQIRYAYYDSLEISSIRPFIDKLEAIRTSIRSEMPE